jgi:micrococcal nuclease
MPSTAGAVRALAVVVCLCAAAACSSGGDQQASEALDVPAPPAGAFAARVERVVDGDTVLASSNGASRRVRLIGIDAPESVQPDAAVECFGPEATLALRRLIPPGTRVRAAYQPGGQVDQFGRQLWDVWLEDGRFVQAELVRQGAVEARSYRPHTEHADLLDRLEDEARSADAGLHGACS